MQILRKLFSVGSLWELYAISLWALCSGTYYWAIFPGWFGIRRPFLDSGIGSLLIAGAAGRTVLPVWHLLRENDRLREAFYATAR
jgi:hypothetical protein